MKKIITLITIAALFYSCKKNEIDNPAFDVVVAKQTYKVNESINFNFNGNPDFITFYSGELGKKYINAQRGSALGKTTMEFKTSSSGGTQINSLALLISSDFSGKGPDNNTTIANIGKATWTDISNRAALSTGASTASGKIDLTDFAAANKPVYIAFKYTVASGSIQRTWYVASPTIVNTLPDSTAFTIADQTSAAINNNGNTNIISPGWISCNVKNKYNWTMTTTTFSIAGAAKATDATDPAEAWLFSGPLNLQKTIPDYGVVVKDITTEATSFSYSYKTPGIYKVTFLGSNKSIYGEKSQVREFTFTIEK